MILRFCERKNPERLSLQDYKLAGINDAEASRVLCDNKLSERTADACQVMVNLSRPVAVEQPCPWKNDTVIVFRPMAENTPDVSGSVTVDAQKELTEDNEVGSLDRGYKVFLNYLQADTDNMVVTSQKRYNKLCGPEDRFSNGFSETLGLNVRAEVSNAVWLNRNLCAKIMQWLRAQPGCVYFPVTQYK